MNSHHRHLHHLARPSVWPATDTESAGGANLQRPSAQPRFADPSWHACDGMAELAMTSCSTTSKATGNTKTFPFTLSSYNSREHPQRLSRRERVLILIPP
jgi:hypothetical protein